MDVHIKTRDKFKPGKTCTALHLGEYTQFVQTTHREWFLKHRFMMYLSFNYCYVERLYIEKIMFFNNYMLQSVRQIVAVIQNRLVYIIYTNFHFSKTVRSWTEIGSFTRKIELSESIAKKNCRKMVFTIETTTNNFYTPPSCI